MASKYLRRSTWWVQFYHPVTRALVRESLGTPHEAKAELLRERINHEVALLDPRFQAVTLPEKVRELVCGPRIPPPERPVAIIQASPSPVIGVVRPASRVGEALKSYVELIRTDNAPHHVALAPRWGYKSPSSVLRVMSRFGITGKKFGDAKQAARRFSAAEVELVEKLAGQTITPRRS